MIKIFIKFLEILWNKYKNFFKVNRGTPTGIRLLMIVKLTCRYCPPRRWDPGCSESSVSTEVWFYPGHPRPRQWSWCSCIQQSQHWNLINERQIKIQFSHRKYVHLPMVGMVVTISPSFNLYRIVVLPAASSPTIRILISFLPKRPLKRVANMLPMVINYVSSGFNQ